MAQFGIAPDEIDGARKFSMRDRATTRHVAKLLSVDLNSVSSIDLCGHCMEHDP
jgi:hypothetical protein